MRRVALLVMAGVLLAGCGTQSPSTATKSWMQTSNFTVNAQQLRHDAEAAARGLRSVATTTKELHTVCAVLSVDTLAANAALPTPDSQLTADLAGAYNDLGGGAQVCYRAGSSQPQRQRAINLLVRGVGSLLASALRASVVTSG